MNTTFKEMLTMNNYENYIEILDDDIQAMIMQNVFENIHENIHASYNLEYDNPEKIIIDSELVDNIIKDALNDFENDFNKLWNTIDITAWDDIDCMLEDYNIEIE